MKKGKKGGGGWSVPLCNAICELGQDGAARLLQHCHSNCHNDCERDSVFSLRLLVDCFAVAMR